jgi:hypothetical protein
MNARRELEIALRGNAMKCARIELETGEKVFLLKVDYTEQDRQAFMESLDLEYDNGYGGQELFGFVWLEDGTWLSRGEYDGSEWWEYNISPEIPSELL